MVNQKELRPGNYILYKETNSPVRVVINDRIIGVEHAPRHVTYQFYEEHFDPIDVTPEILESAGFFNPGNSNFIHNDTGILVRFDNGKWDIWQRAEMGKLGFVAAFNSLHKLQNYFLDLTEKELKIDLLPHSV